MEWEAFGCRLWVKGGGQTVSLVCVIAVIKKQDTEGGNCRCLYVTGFHLPMLVSSFIRQAKGDETLME